MKIIRSLILSLSFAASLALQLVYAQVPAKTVTLQLSAFEQKLREVRYDLRLENGRFVGNAAPVLESAIANAQYVLIGEDHITREIPQFTTAVCDIMAPAGVIGYGRRGRPTGHGVCLVRIWQARSTGPHGRTYPTVPGQRRFSEPPARE